MVAFRHILCLVLAGFLLPPIACVQAPTTSPGPSSTSKFRKHVVSNVFVSEGAAAGDVNNDGRIDILAGPYWYEAPHWQRHQLHADTLDPVKGYSTTFLNFCADINQDGWPDLIRFDVPGAACHWYENPQGKQVLWQRHLILASAGIETPLFVDVDGDSRKDIICNDAEKKEVVWIQAPAKKGDTVWVKNVISNDPERGTHRYTHGIGWGDVNGDGRTM